MEFSNNLPTQWQTYWEELGYEKPSLIQEKSYELLACGKNLVGISPTGSGKTVAYLLPLLQKIKKGEGNQLLILLPSQELAVQVASVTKSWAERLELQVASLIGGANVRRQIEKLKEKPEVLIGTPGRVHELIKERKVRAHLLQMVVLDEVDQLIETSELNATKNILKAIRNETQLVCVSATAFDVTDRLGDNWTQELITLDVSKEDQSAGEVLHGFIRTTPRKRVELLRKMAYINSFKGIIFFNELQEMGTVADKLTYQGVANVTLASDQNKLERRLALTAFEENKVKLLLTTDIAARGLDFTALPYVVHYDVPYSPEGYLHRSGRTGRMGQAGHVVTLAGDYDLPDLKKIRRGMTNDLVELTLHAGKIVPLTEQALVKVAPELDITQATPPVKKKKTAAVPATQPVRKKKRKAKDTKNKGARRKKE